MIAKSAGILTPSSAGASDLTNRITCIFGKKGYGKSYRISKLVPEIPGTVIIVDPLAEYGALGLTVQDPGDIVQAIKGGYHRIRFLPEEGFDFNLLCLLCYRMGNLTLVVDEISMFQETSMLPAGLGCIVQYGRHKQVSLIVASRRPAEVNRLITSQADEFWVFGISEKRDLDYLANYFSPEQVENIRSFPPWSCYHIVLPDVAEIVTP